MPRLLSRQWTWQFDHPPEAVWAVMADTARFNEAAGFPKHQIEEQAQSAGSVVYVARARIGPFSIEWQDIPVEWVAGKRFVHRRRFRRGPFRRLDATLELTGQGAGTRADYRIEIEPTTLVAWLPLTPLFFRSMGRTFDRLIAQVKRFLDGASEAPFDIEPPDLPSANKARVEAIVKRIEDLPSGHGLARRLADFTLAAPELEVRQIRPLRLGRVWDAEPRDVVELCLQAARHGLLGMEWVLMCPRCRGAKVAAPSLDRLPTGTHCPSCNIDYGRDFQKNVELTFHPAANIRPIDSGEFCLFGPMTTPHVKIQQTLDPGEERTVAADLAFGAYRLRNLHAGGQRDIDWSRGGFPQLVNKNEGVETGPPGPAGAVSLVNRGSRQTTLVVEERQWVADALTAHRATTLQSFRDLLPDQALRPGDEMSIDRITLMFSDLKGSTALYERIGDVAAYNLVRDHFAYLTEAVRAHNGAVVKTIGDAVMATFAEPADGLEAALAVQRNVADFNRRHAVGALVIKLGLHQGPVVAVRLNDRLDYFGTSVNMAARLQGQSEGGDIVLSRALARDPAVAPLIKALKAERKRAKIRGFKAPVAFTRLPADALATPAP